MNAEHGERSLWRGPVAVWLLLLILLAVTVTSSFVPMGVANTAVNLVIAAVMLMLLGFYLMDLVGTTALIRLAAASGLLWLIFMFTLTFADYWSRT
jgi:cytochrome c oxidase subunit IV